MARRRIVISVRGVFGKGFLTTMSMKQAKRRLASAVRKYGYGNVMRRLNALAVLQRGVNQKARKRAEKLKKWLKRKYGRKRK